MPRYRMTVTFVSEDTYIRTFDAPDLESAKALLKLETEQDDYINHSEWSVNNSEGKTDDDSLMIFDDTGEMVWASDEGEDGDDD